MISDSASAPSDAFRRELRGTGAIVLVIVAVIGSGWAGSSLVARSMMTLGPRVTVEFGPGWGESYIGPTDLFSRRRQLSSAELVLSPTYESHEPDELLESYRTEVIVTEVASPTFEDVRSREHPAGTAFVQRWTAAGSDGDVLGEMVVVANGGTAVVLDGRWPADEEPAVIEEIRRVVDSLVIEPLVP